jgi:hypothetical protein
MRTAPLMSGLVPGFFHPIILYTIWNKLNLLMLDAINPAQCPLCNQLNHCQLCSPLVYKGQCWCAHEEISAGLLARIPENFRNRACICRACVKKFQLEKALSRTHPAEAAQREP